MFLFSKRIFFLDVNIICQLFYSSYLNLFLQMPFKVKQVNLRIYKKLGWQYEFDSVCIRYSLFFKHKMCE